MIILQNDLVILPVETAKKMADMTRLVLINRVAAGIHVIDPLTGEV